MNLHGAVAIVTGASMGIGAATARAFAKEGARVALAARSVDALAALMAELGAEAAMAVPTDMTDKASVDAMVGQVLARWGRVDVLVNNAGVGLSGALATADPAQFQHVLDVNLFGPLYAAQAVIPHMRKPAGGLIINVSSMVTKLTIPTIGGYRASKTALNTLSDNLRLELARDNIRVVTVYPGITRTNFFDNTINASSSRSMAGGMASDTPEHVAAKIVAAAQHEPREIYMHTRDRIIAGIVSTYPRLFEWIMSRRTT